MYIKAAMSGLLPMSVSLIAAAALLLMNKENFIDYRSSLIFAVAFGVTWKWNIHTILLITLSGIAGYILYKNFFYRTFPATDSILRA